MRRGAPLGLVPLLLAPLLTGCDDMVHQPKRTDYSNAAVAPAEVPAGRARRPPSAWSAWPLTSTRCRPRST